MAGAPETAGAPEAAGVPEMAGAPKTAEAGAVVGQAVEVVRRDNSGAGKVDAKDEAEGHECGQGRGRQQC